MDITPSHVEKFRKLYKKTFKEDLSYDEASEQCAKLVLLVKLTYRAVAISELERLKNKA